MLQQCLEAKIMPTMDRDNPQMCGYKAWDNLQRDYGLSNRALKHAWLMRVLEKKPSDTTMATGVKGFFDTFHGDIEKLLNLKLDMWEVLTLHGLAQVKAQWPDLTSHIHTILAAVEDKRETNPQHFSGKGFYMEVHRRLVNISETVAAELKTKKPKGGFLNSGPPSGGGRYKNQKKGKERNKPTSASKNTGQSNLCFRCDSAEHLAPDCPYKESTCSYCKKVGHLSRACNKKKKE
jgi:hypothetical protein